MQKRAELAHIGERRDARRRAALDLAFSRGKCLAQFAEAGAADQRRQQQTVGLERAADLDQRAGQIIYKLQRQAGDNQIERGIRERHGFFIGGDANKIGRKPTRVGLGRNDEPDPPRFSERAAHRIVRRAEIDRERKLPRHRRETLGHVGGDPVEQKRLRPERRSAGPASAQQGAVEDGRVCRHLLEFTHE